MESTEAQIILANFIDRIEEGSDGKHRLSGVITQAELEALHLLVSDVQPSFSIKHEKGAEVGPTQPEGRDGTPVEVSLKTSGDEHVVLDLSTLDLPMEDQPYRVCMDFGTAMSKAAFVQDGDSDDIEDIQVLQLGIPGDQEQIDEAMLVSSVFIDTDGLLWFGQHAVERANFAPEGQNGRIDNIKRALSEGNLTGIIDSGYNPTKYSLTYEDVILAYLTFFTWAVNVALVNDIDDLGAARNFKRRFAMPCFPRANAQMVSDKLKVLLGEAQILADTFGDGVHDGLPLGQFLSAVKQLRTEKRSYSFIGSSITEPLGVAGSLLSWKKGYDALVLIVDIGAGTSDFSLFRMKVTVNEDGTVNQAKTRAGEVDGTACGITEAGNHLDKILKAHVFSKANIDTSHPQYPNIAHDLERDIRHHKEELFTTGSALIVLRNEDAVEVSLNEFMDLPAVKDFERSLRDTVDHIMESADKAWMERIRADARRKLIVVLTGGGASLPMVKQLAQGTMTAHGITIPVAPAQPFPAWMHDDYPDLEAIYPRIAVSLGGARKHIIQSIGALKSTGGATGGFTLDRY